MHGGGRDRHNLEALRWFDSFLLKTATPHDSDVALFVTGRDIWEDVGDDVEGGSVRWYLAAGGRLLTAPADGPPSSYTYDPADPTPAVGLASFDPENALPRDNRALEQRPDVLVFTADPFENDVQILGPVAADLSVTSSAQSADFFVRITDVAPDGSSTNVLDGLTRVERRPELRGPHPLRVAVDLGFRAHEFRSGHRMRVQVSSGAFPFYARNLGTGEDLATGTRMVVAEQALWHDTAWPSTIDLTIRGSSS
jgi:putative CocE/NonD family hydrolase